MKTSFLFLVALATTQIHAARPSLQIDPNKKVTALLLDGPNQKVLEQIPSIPYSSALTFLPFVSQQKYRTFPGAFGFDPEKNILTFYISTQGYKITSFVQENGTFTIYFEKPERSSK